MDQALSSSIMSFSSRFCQELVKDSSVISSPLSVEVVLGLLALGTSEPSHSQLLGVLGLKDNDAVRSAFSSVCTKLKSPEGVTLDIANKIYLKEGDYQLVPQLKADAIEVFDADIEKINFVESDKSASNINKWVEEKTHNRIKDIVKPDDFNAATRLVLINALYFKGKWKDTFNANLTKDRPFNVNLQTQVNIAMMYREGNYRYGESDVLQAQLLELPYVGGQASMVVVLPREVEGLAAMMQKLASGHDLMQDLQSMRSTKVQVTLPKFKIETEIDLKPLLKNLGVSAIFEPVSGLTGILDNKEPLIVSKAIQKAFIEVNEEGAEAAAATVVAVAMCCAIVDAPTPSFVADRPFLVMINVRNAPCFVAQFRAGA